MRRIKRDGLWAVLVAVFILGCGRGNTLKIRGLKNFTVEFEAFEGPLRPGEKPSRSKLKDEVVHIEIVNHDGLKLSSATLGLDEVWGKMDKDPKVKKFVSVDLPLLARPSGPINHCEGIKAIFTVRIQEERLPRYTFFKQIQDKGAERYFSTLSSGSDYKEYSRVWADRNHSVWRTLLSLKVNLHDGTTVQALNNQRKPTGFNALDLEQETARQHEFNLYCSIS